MSESIPTNPFLHDLLKRFPDRASLDFSSLTVEELKKIKNGLDAIFPGTKLIPHTQLQSIYFRVEDILMRMGK